MITTINMLSAALTLAARGFAVFPCHRMTPTGCSCSKPACGSPGKHPVTPNGFKSATRDPERIRALWTDAPHNIGIATGAASNIVVIDSDPRHGGDLSALHLPPTLTARTGSGGLHLFFIHPGGRVPNSASRLAPGVDVRGDGGYVVAPPSNHASGGVYAWEEPRAGIASCPAEVVEAMRRRGPRSSAKQADPLEQAAPKTSAKQDGAVEKPPKTRSSTSDRDRERRYALATLEGAARDLAAVPDGGGRNQAAYDKAHKVGGYIPRHLSEAEAEAHLLHATRAGGWERADERKTADTIRRGLRDGASRPLTVPDAPATGSRSASVTLQSVATGVEADERAAIQAEEPTEPAMPTNDETIDPARALLAAPPPPASVILANQDVIFPAGISPTSDIANAARLAAWHGDDLRYCDALGGWYAWDGRRWAQDNAAAWRAAEETARRLMQTARDKEERKNAERTQNVAGIDAMLRAARNRIGIITAPADFDADAYALNVANGLLDLRTGELRAHSRAALCRRIAPATWQGLDARHDVLDRFLGFATEPHEGLLDFLSRMAGLALIGENPFEAFFVNYGFENTGKSTWNDAFTSTLGDYAVTAAVETFMSQDSRRTSGAEATPDIARLAGTRLVLCSESKRKARLDEAIIKRVTSDTMVGRFLHKDPFEFDITFKVWLATNFQPSVDPAERAIWRRLYLVPLDRIVPPEARDPRIKAAMGDASVIGPALLAFAMRGCLALLANGPTGIPLGLAPPPCVRDATDAYRAAQDPLKDFLEDSCVLFDPKGNPLPVDPTERRDLFEEDGCWVNLADLRKAYELWAKEQGQSLLLGPRAFGVALAAHGCITMPRWMPVSKTNVRTWFGVRLRRPSDDHAALPARH